MNIIIVFFEFIVIILTLALFVYDIEEGKLAVGLNIILCSAIVIMILLNLTMVCRGFSWAWKNFCLSCGTGGPNAPETTRNEQAAKKAIYDYRVAKNPELYKNKQGGGLFSFSKPEDEVDLNKLEGSDEEALFYGLTPQQIVTQAKNNTSNILKNRAAEQARAATAELNERVRKAAELEQKAKQPSPIAVATQQAQARYGPTPALEDAYKTT